jgi:hypothetical protein
VFKGANNCIGEKSMQKLIVIAALATALAASPALAGPDFGPRRDSSVLNGLYSSLAQQPQSRGSTVAVDRAFERAMLNPLKSAFGCRPGDVCAIRLNRGGKIRLFQAAARQAGSTTSFFVAGRCDSACVVALSNVPPANIRIGRNAVFGFHLATDRTILPMGTQDLQQAARTHGSGVAIKSITASQAKRMGLFAGSIFE